MGSSRDWLWSTPEALAFGIQQRVLAATPSLAEQTHAEVTEQQTTVLIYDGLSGIDARDAHRPSELVRERDEHTDDVPRGDADEYAPQVTQEAVAVGSMTSAAALVRRTAERRAAGLGRTAIGQSHYRLKYSAAL